MFGYIKNIIKNKCLKDAAVRTGRRREVAYNFETAKTMSVIYPFNINMSGIMNVLKNITKQYDIEIVLVMYFPQEKLPEGVGENSPSQIFFSNNECNWFGKPKTAAINSFINTKFNILVDLSIKVWFPLQYIATASHADFKIGRINSETNNPYDFVLAGSADDERFFKDLETYLCKIK
ncbi:MAG: hypothetical protein LBE04_03475 [Prevotellaceae bacterium]|jgi:hypothetical protein|nr:hypothetical protein [Prevotellaceae bacterium]